MKKKSEIKKENTIACPECGTEIDIADILKSQVAESLDVQLKAELKKQQKEFEQREAELREELADEKKVELKRIQESLQKKLQAEATVQSKALQQELAEKDKKLEQFAAQELALRKQKRELEDQQRELELNINRKMDEERQKIQEDLGKKISEEHQQKEQQLQKQLNDVTKQLEEAKRKAEQGSTQAQGEVFELALEDILRDTFALDQIKAIAKGVSGADVHQQIFDRTGQSCGLIVWESKQTKSWNKSWVSKLKDDLLTAQGDVGVIVSTILPDGINHFGQVDGIWITDFESAVALAAVLRVSMIDNTKVRHSVQGKNEKMEAMYTYLSGPQFRQRVENIVGSFTSMQEDLNKEKVAYVKIWAKREKQIQRVLENTVGMHGDLHGLMGSNLPELPTVDLLAIGDEDE